MSMTCSLLMSTSETDSQAEFIDPDRIIMKFSCSQMVNCDKICAQSNSENNAREHDCCWSNRLNEMDLKIN